MGYRPGFAAGARRAGGLRKRIPDRIGQTFGHYRIEAKLGEGGMGVVYKARDTHLDRSVAINALPRRNPERKRRFVQEAKAASALNHPNIVHIYGIDTASGVDFMAMEYVEGKTLDDVIGPKGLKTGETLQYAVQIADALATAMQRGLCIGYQALEQM